MADGELDLLVERLALDSAAYRRLVKRVEARRAELFPPTPPPHVSAPHGGGCMCAECFGAEATGLRDEEYGFIGR